MIAENRPRTAATPDDRLRRLARTVRAAEARLWEASRTCGDESAAALCEDLSRKRRRYADELAAALGLPARPVRRPRRDVSVGPAAVLRAVARGERALQRSYEAALGGVSAGPLRDRLAAHLAELRRDFARLESLRRVTGLRRRFAWPEG